MESGREAERVREREKKKGGGGEGNEGGLEIESTEGIDIDN